MVPRRSIDDLQAALAACDEVPVAAPRSRMPRATEGLDAEVTAVIAEMHARGASFAHGGSGSRPKRRRAPTGVRWTASAVARGLTG